MPAKKPIWSTNSTSSSPSRFNQGYALKKAIHTEAVEICLEHQDGVGYYPDYRCVEVVGAYHWLTERELCILTEVDQAEAFAPILALRNTILTMGIGVAVIAALAGAILARTITRPVSRLVQGAEAIGRGELEYQIEVGGKDEIGNLEDAFNEMAANLRDSLGQTAYGQRLLLALSQAAQAAQRARTPEEIFAIGDKEISDLGYNVIIFSVLDDRTQLVISHMSFESALLRAAEKMVGISAKDFILPIKPGSSYSSIITAGQAAFFENAIEPAKEFLPQPAHPLARQTMAMLGTDSQIQLLQGIPFEAFGYYREILLKLENVIVSHLDDLPPDKARGEREWDKEHGFRPLLFIPLYFSGKFRGTMGFYGRVAEEIEWTEEFIEMLHFAGNIITSAIQRRQVEAELRKLSLAVEQSPSTVMITAPQGLIEYINPRFTQLTGYTFDEIRGTNAAELGDQPDAEAAKMWATLRTGQTWRGEFPNRKKKGDHYWELASIASIKDQHGTITHFVKVAEDITERLELQDSLVRSEKLAVLGQQAGGVAHELRNPLGAIKNAAYFLNLVVEAPDPSTTEMLELITREVTNSERIISDLLDFARTKSPTRQKVALNNVLQETLARLEVPEQIEVISRLQDDLPETLADPGQLNQIFNNIIQNGIQAMTSTGSAETPDSGQLTVETRLENPEWLSVTIADTGMGMSPETLAKIFEPLFTTRAKGIGLGLAIVKTLVAGHGGTIEVESRPGQGSSFTIRLPLQIEGEGD